MKGKMPAKLFRVDRWQRKTKIVVSIVLLVLIVVGILSTMMPTREEMLANTSEAMQQRLAEDAQSTRKRLTISYNPLFCVSYLSVSSSGRDVVSESYVGFCNQIIPANDGAMQVVGQMINYTYRMLGGGRNLMYGAKLTILLTTITVFFGLILGTLLSLGKISKFKPLSKICSGYIFFFRGTPLLIQLFVVYFTLPKIFDFSWTGLFSAYGTDATYMGSFLASCITFSLNSGAYCAEIVRAAIQSIDKGQHEAAKALGMTYWQTMSHIVIPQSIRRMIPPVCNEFVMILKDASIVFAISLQDITTIANNIRTSEGSNLVFIPALILYLIITALFTFIFSPRGGTPAAKMEDPTPKEEKNRRFDRLCEVQNRISLEIHQNYIGKTMLVLVDGKDGDQLTARTEGGRLVRMNGGDELIGQFVHAKITGCTTWSLVGELAE